MKQSHNDYWNRVKLHRALNENCNIIEVDVIYLRGDLYCSHSWRPHPALTYGRLEEYFKAMERYGEKEVYLYVEIKTSDWRAIDTMGKLLKKYPGVKVLVKGVERWFSPDREWIARVITRQNKNAQSYDEYRARVGQNEIAKLYKITNWRRWNRW